MTTQRRQKLTWVQIANLTACPNCGSAQGVPCQWEHAKTHWARTKKAYRSVAEDPRYVNGKARVMYPSEYRGKVSGGDISPYLKKPGEDA